MRKVCVRLADPSVVIVPGRDEVPLDPGIQLGVSSPKPVHPDHVRQVFLAAVEDTEQRERADEKQDREEDERERVKAIVEVCCLPDQRQADNAGRDEGQEDRDPDEQLVLGRAPRREQAPMLGREQLRPNRWRDLLARRDL